MLTKDLTPAHGTQILSNSRIFANSYSGFPDFNSAKQSDFISWTNIIKSHFFANNKQEVFGRGVNACKHPNTRTFLQIFEQMKDTSILTAKRIPNKLSVIVKSLRLGN